MSKKTELYIRIAMLLVVVIGVVALYFQLKAEGKDLDQQAYQSLAGHGTLNVVFAVIGVILAGLFIFLWRLDRKVAKLEQDHNVKS